MILKEIHFSKESISLINKFFNLTNLNITVKNFLEVFNKDLDIKYIKNKNSKKINQYVKNYGYENKLNQRVKFQTENNIINCYKINNIFHITELRLDLKKFNLELKRLNFSNEKDIERINKLINVSKYIIKKHSDNYKYTGGSIINDFEMIIIINKSGDFFLEFRSVHYNKYLIQFKLFESIVDFKNRFLESFIIEEISRYKIFLDNNFDSLDNLDLKLLEIIDYS